MGSDTESPFYVMDIAEILKQLERNDGYFARAGVAEAAAHREEIVPALLRILEDVADDPRRFVEDQDYMAHIYAMFLLAQFRETRAHPLLVRIFSVPGKLVLDLAGDVVTENLGGLLASTSGGDINGMKALIENEQANEYVRSAAMRGLLALVGSGQRTREEVMTYFASLFTNLDRTPSHAWSSLVCCCTDLGPMEVQAEILRAYEDELVDPFVIQWHEVEEAAQLGEEAALERLRRSRLGLITDVTKEMEWWACFSKEPKRKSRLDDLEFPSVGGLGLQEPFQRNQPKVGRNAPCPCGSGKKYKKCCGA